MSSSGGARERSRSAHKAQETDGTQVGDSEEIKELIKAREEARCAKNFAEADDIRSQLHDMGVEVWDKEKMWKQPSTGLTGVILGYFGDRPPSDIEISALVIRREKARLARDFTMSDTIRDELKERGVSLFDKEREWRSKDGRRGTIPTFDDISNGLARPGRTSVGASSGATGGNLQAQLLQLAVSNPAIAPQILSILPHVIDAGAPVPTQKPVVRDARTDKALEALSFAESCVGETVSDEDIDYFVQAREDCRKARDFAGADAIRTKMRLIGLEVNDKDKAWTMADGREGVILKW